MGDYKEIFTYDELYDLYINKKMTSRQIAKQYNTNKTKVLSDLKRFGITYENQLDSYKINKLQHDLIIGSILGDGTFLTDGGDYRMSFRHAENQKEYLLFKFEMMKEFCKKKTIGVSDGNYKSFKNGQLIYYFHTRALEIFNDYKKMSIIESLEQLNENSFSIWMMDDGSMYDRNVKYTPYFTLSAKRFSLEEAEKTKKVIKEKFNIDCTINTMKKDYYQNGKNYEINGFYFPTSETYKVKDIIINSDFGNQLMKIMSYKIPS